MSRVPGLRDRIDVWLFLGALLVRLGYVFEIHGGPLFRYLLIDSAFYDEFARRLATGDGFAEGPFFMNVLYGLFLGGVYAVTGDDAGGRLAALLVQAGLGAAAVLATRRLGEAVGESRAGTWAAAALAIFGPAIFYDGALLTPSLLLALTLFTTLAALRARERGGMAAAIGLGIWTGLLVLGRANHLLLLVMWCVLLARGRGTPGLRAAAACAVACLLVVAPVTLRNLAAADEFVLVTANGGMALWAGNFDGANGIYSTPEFLSNPVPEREAEDYRAEASRRAGRELTLAGSSRFWAGETLGRWLEEPGAMLGLTARKARYFFHATESQTNLSYYFALDLSRVLAVCRLHFGWVWPFALAGIVLTGRRHLVVLAPVLVSGLTCLVFYMSSEYRHPVLPHLLLFGALGVERAVAAWRGGGWRTRTAWAIGLLALLVGTNVRDALLTRLQSKRVDYFNFGSLAASAGNLEEAESLLRGSIAIDPQWPPSRAKLAEVLQRLGRPAEAGEQAGLAGDVVPPPAARSLRDANEHFQAGRFAEARDVFLAVAREGGEARPSALNNAGLCAMRLGRSAEAESLFRSARAADSTYSSPVVHLGRLSLALGDSAAARAYAEEALRIEPGDARARRLQQRATGTEPD